MTITTANLSAHRLVKWPGNAALRLTPLALAVLLLSTDCRAEWRVTPGVQARETWSDNVGSEINYMNAGDGALAVTTGGKVIVYKPQ